MQTQFNGEVTDVPALLAELRSAGLEVEQIETSRWLGADETGAMIDRGGRIDVTIPAIYAVPANSGMLTLLGDTIAASSYVVGF